MRSWSVGWLLALTAVTFGYQGGSRESASIEGRVIARATGAPVKDAIVRLRELPSSPGQLVDNEWVQQTNEGGRFVFANLPPGDWRLSAEKRGFVTAKYGERKYEPQGGAIPVKQNQQIKDVVLTLVSQAVVTGRVLDVDGEPVEGARVTVLRKAGYANGAPRWSEAAFATTLDDGGYRIPRLDGGRYLVKCAIGRVDRTESSSGSEATYATTYFPNVIDPSLAVEIEVQDGGETGGIDLRLASVRVFRVRGKLLVPASRGSSGYVALVDRSDPTKVFAYLYPAPPDYLINFRRIPPGSYVAYGWWGYGYDQYVASQPVEVKDRDVDDLLLGPAAGEIPVSVRVKPGGRQVNLRNVDVVIRPMSLGTGSDRPGEMTRTGDLTGPIQTRFVGYFAGFAVEVPRIPQGCYIVSIQYGGKDVPDAGIEYSAGAALEIVIGSDGATVDGATLDQDGKPVGGAVVALIPAEGKSATRSSKSDPQGAFQITGVPPGEYKLLAWDDVGRDDLENPDFVKRFENQPITVKLAASGAATASIRIIAQEPLR